MKKIMTYLGYFLLIIPIFIESLIKLVWGIVYYTFRPLWRQCFPDSIEKMENYTKFKYQYIVVPKIIKLWED